MPYVITTKRLYPYKAANAVPPGATIDTRRAVATLEDARRRLNVSAGIAESEQTGIATTLFAQIDALTESGGTVGPLPDGTVIEVAKVLDQHLVFELPNDVKRDLWRRHATTIPRAEIIDAYNARQSA